MITKKIILFVCLFLIADSVIAQQDSMKLYKDIESYSRRSKFTKFIYRLIFKTPPTSSPASGVKKKVYKKLIQKPYSAFEDKVIRHIHITTLDPFGQSLADTIKTGPNFLLDAGNKLHLKSQRITIRNLLLIRPNQRFDSLLVKESERLVRSQGYIRDVLFFVRPAAKNSDSVDIYIRALDRWSITPAAAGSPSKVVVLLNDKNIFGLGHEFKNGYTWYHTTGDDGYKASYYIPNIRNTYINTTLAYGTDEFRNFNKTFAIARPFFSPFARWAGGADFTQQLNRSEMLTEDSITVLQNYKLNAQDYWAGNAMQIFRGNSEDNRTTNFISAVRFLRMRFAEKPPDTIDTLRKYADENFYMAAIGISTRKYVQDSYIFNYGLTEDVPIGKVYGLTIGYQEKATGRLYIGARIAVGNYYEWGYLSADAEYGTFFRTSHPEQGIFSAGFTYFTGLSEVGKWKFRQFAKPRFTMGLNRFSYDSLTINGGRGIEGFNSPSLSGTVRAVLTFQTQSYAPWNVLGFRFGPFVNFSMGMLGSSSTGFRNSRLYSQFGFGFLIRNENLVFNTLQLSVSFYPIIPGNGNNSFKINSVKTGDFGLRDFEFGKPRDARFE